MVTADVVPRVVVPFPRAEAPAAAPNRTYARRWKHETLFSKGHVGVPVLFLQYYARLKPYLGVVTSMPAPPGTSYGGPNVYPPGPAR